MIDAIVNPSGTLCRHDRDGQQHAERRRDHEARGDRHAVEERVDAEPEERQVAGRGAQQRLRVDLFAEVEVRRDRVLEEVHAEVADQDEEERVRDLRAFGQHAHERGRQHEPGAARDEIAQRRQPLLVHGGHEQGAREIGDRRGGHEGQVC